MKNLDERQVNVLKTAEEWHWRAMLTPWRFIVVPAVLIWRLIVAIAVVLIAVPVAAVISLLIAATRIYDDATDVFNRLTWWRLHKLASFCSVAPTILKGKKKD